MGRLLDPGRVFQDNNGAPAASGTLTFYTTGTTTLKDTFSDSTLTTTNVNPLALGSDGRLNVEVFGTGTYTIRLADVNGATQWSEDDVRPANEPDPDDIDYDQGAAGAVVRSVTARLQDWISVKDFGAAGDGVTDDTTAFTNAFAAAVGGTLFIPEGVYVLAIDTDPMFSPGFQTRVVGDGWRSTLRFNMVDASAYVLFDTPGQFRMEHLRIEINTTVGAGSIVCFGWGSDVCTLHDLQVGGGVTSSTTHTFHVLKCDNTGTFSDLTLSQCFIENVNRVWLRENAATSTVSRVRFESSHFRESSAGLFSMNAPNGAVSDVVWANNHFKDPFIAGIGETSSSVCIGPQVTNGAITGNTFQGNCHQVIHIEEAANNLSITGNTINMNCADTAIFVTDNDVGGADVTPARVVINGNVIKRTDGSNVGHGVELVNDASPLAPLELATISDNVIVGWDRGISYASEGHDRVNVNDNVIEDCTVGIWSVRGSGAIRNNTVSNCQTGLEVTGGGAYGFTRFFNCNSNLVSAGGELTLLGFEIEYPRTTLLAAANEDLPLFNIGASDRMYGDIVGHAFHTDTNEDTDMTTLDWDGTTLNQTNRITKGGGAVAISWQDIGPGVLNMRVFNAGAALTDASIFCHFDGVYMSG